MSSPGVRLPVATAGKDTSWLLRYARHCRVELDASRPEANALKSCFTQAAWRLVCRSGRDSFIPILHNRGLTFDSLVHYTQTLVENGFQTAPGPEMLGYFIRASYVFFDRKPSVPDNLEEMTVLHLATRHGLVTSEQLRRVHEWIGLDGFSLNKRMTWTSVLRRANTSHQRRLLSVMCDKANISSGEKNSWYFATGRLNWRSYEILPLANAAALWDEGQAMSSCLYNLRRLCNKTGKPSRFFSVTKNGRRHATLELVREPAHESMRGPDRIYGRWQLQDCRLSCNRLPSAKLIEALTDFSWHYNLLSQRPGRQAGVRHLSQRDTG